MAISVVLLGLVAMPNAALAKFQDKQVQGKQVQKELALKNSDVSPLVEFEDSVVLRDLTVLRDTRVIDFNDDHVLLTGERRVGWDEILKASVTDGLRESFDAKLAQLGLPLFRLKVRLANEDWSGIGELAEPMYQRLKLQTLASKTSSRSDYLVCIATMESRIYRGDRAGAVLPFLQAVLMQRELRRISSTGMRFYLSSDEEETMLSERILPIWFDGSQVGASFESLANSFVPTSRSKQLGAIVYLASLAIEKQRLELAKELIALVGEGEGDFVAWHVVLQSQLKIASGDFRGSDSLIKRSTAQGELPEGNAKLVASYLSFAEHFVEPESEALDKKFSGNDRASRAWPPDGSDKQRKKSNGQVLETANERANVMLGLLKIPAINGSRFPALSAAAIFQATQIAQSLQWRKEQVILEQELSYRFPTSFHARQLKERNTLEKSN